MASYSSTSPSQPIATWLFICCLLIFMMVVLGGATRLTHSGLSIVEWKPLTGILPPLSESQWEEAFHKYQQFPEYQKLNVGMTLEGFKSIFWLEYLHRLWGRLIGVVFLLPFLYFLVKGRINKALLPRLTMLLVLGGIQGGFGWYLVMSGLVDRPDVSQYRLTGHLGLAVLIYSYMLWTALGLRYPRSSLVVSPTLHWAVAGLGLLVFVTILSGGLVAGLDAGFIYNTFPLMGGQLIPQDMWVLKPLLRNLFENPTTVQFVHRLLAILTLLTTWTLWLWWSRRPLPTRTRTALHGLLGAAVIQVALGISTLLLIVPLPLAIAHQAGALILFTVVVWVLHELSRGQVTPGIEPNRYTLGPQTQAGHVQTK